MSDERDLTQAPSTDGRDGAIVLAGGGTGGHISPGIAIAEEIAELAPEFARVFACSTRAVDAQMLAHVGADFVPIAAEGLSLKPARLYRFARAFLEGRAQARELLVKRRARAVVSRAADAHRASSVPATGRRLANCVDCSASPFHVQPLRHDVSSNVDRS